MIPDCQMTRVPNWGVKGPRHGWCDPPGRLGVLVCSLRHRAQPRISAPSGRRWEEPDGSGHWQTSPGTGWPRRCSRATRSFLELVLPLRLRRRGRRCGICGPLIWRRSDTWNWRGRPGSWSRKSVVAWETFVIQAKSLVTLVTNSRFRLRKV